MLNDHLWGPCRSGRHVHAAHERDMRAARRGTRIAVAAVLVAALGIARADRVSAQLRAPLGASSGWAPAGIGVRGGRDSALHYYVVGGQVWVPLVPDGTVELMPNADLTFARGQRERQYNLELVYVMGGREGGLYGGGGIGFRNAVFGPDPTAPRQTHRGYTAVLGFKFGQRVSPQIEWRWVFIKNEGINPEQVTLGVTFALWR
jgi:hypothetical protein